jgi:hypothetical protein
MDVTQRDFDTLAGRNVDACDAGHFSLLTLSRRFVSSCSNVLVEFRFLKLPERVAAFLPILKSQ